MQAVVHPVIDSGMVVGELRVAMRDTKLVQPPNEPAGSVEQVELILLTAVNEERLQAAEILPLAFDRNDRALPYPVRPAVLDIPQVSNVTGSRTPRNCVGSGSSSL